MPAWNRQLFLLINAPAHPSAWVAGFAILLADSPVVIAPALLVVLWIRGRSADRDGLLVVAGGMLVGLGLNQLAGLLYFEPRPFMIGLGHTLLSHAPDNSFPSDPATLVWALGFGLVLTGAAKGWGAATCVYGIAVGYSRVYLGVHFPIDVIASAPVGLAAAGVACIGRPLVAAWVLPPVENLYEGSLRILRLPAAIAPRRAGKPRDLGGADGR